MIQNIARIIIASRFVRFLLSGGLNTVVTYGIYLVLLQWLSYRMSYTLAYVFGIALAYQLNRTFVFCSHRGARTLFSFPLVYLAQYLLGLFVLWFWIDRFELNQKLGPMVVIVITLPITYVLSRLSFMGTGHKKWRLL